MLFLQEKYIFNIT